MKVSYSWLKEFVDIKISPKELAEKLTMAGLSVASLDQVSGDWVYDIEVTSNRPDCLSVRGIVREVAAITGAKLARWPVGLLVRSNKNKKNRITGPPFDAGHGFQPWALAQDSAQGAGAKGATGSARGAPQANRLTIKIDDKTGCRAYYGNLITGVVIGPSPEWLKKRLEVLGLRPVNNVVDITNYCLLEFGQPLHAFDFDKIGSAEIIVRRAKDGESLVLIDGSEKKLDRTLLVIADSRRPLAAAGIMGGRDSEVSLVTKNVLLESACFDPVVVRRGTRALGVSSDSSYRFERGVDRGTVKTALDQATRMICDLCGGELGVSKFQGARLAFTKRKIIFDSAKAKDILSLDLLARDIKNILEKLGFGVKPRKKGVFEIIVPDFRRDVTTSEDITEEIARSYGYDKIPLTAPQIKPFSMETPKAQILEKRFKALLVSMGLKEVITYSLTSRQDYEKSSLLIPEDAASLENPLSQDYQILRTTLLPRLLQCAAFNINHNNIDFEIFESAHIFKEGKESLCLGILLCGARRSSWTKESRAYTFFDLKGIVESLFKESKIRDYGWKLADIGLARQGAGASIVVANNPAGVLAQVSEAVKRAWGIKTKEDIFVAELLIEELLPHSDLKKNFSPIAAMPSIWRDISLLVGPSVSYAKIKEAVRRQAKGYLKRISLADCYQGKEVPKGHLGLTISLEYGSDQKTLTEAEVNPVHQAVLGVLKNELSLTLR
jgi:phenylalanyl-tRNA synthetase beta chain